jgi:hypothetical protein
MADEIVILTTVDRVRLTAEEAACLLEHVRRDGGDNHARASTPLSAATDRDGTVELRWSDGSKAIVLAAITAWLDTEGARDVPGVMDLRYELMRDLKLPPFDTQRRAVAQGAPPDLTWGLAEGRAPRRALTLTTFRCRRGRPGSRSTT